MQRMEIEFIYFNDQRVVKVVQKEETGPPINEPFKIKLFFIPINDTFITKYTDFFFFVKSRGPNR